MKQRVAVFRVLVAALGTFGATAMTGQILHSSRPLPSFEVATIKPWKANARPLIDRAQIKVDLGSGIRRHESNRVHFIGQVDLLIMDAYNLPIGSEKRILRGPKWVDSEDSRYEIFAKIDTTTFAAMQGMSAEQQHEQISLMEQSLLSERFHLKVHFESRGEMPVYALVPTKEGVKLTPAREGEATKLSSNGNEITGQAVTISQFAHSPLWTPIGDRFVVDHTGLTGLYDFTLKWRADPVDGFTVTETSEDLPPLFDAIKEQLGLKVVDSKAPLEVIIIDHIERPSPN